MFQHSSLAMSAHVKADTAPRRDEGAEWRRLRQELRVAAQAHAFTFLYQPRLALSDGALCGVQALLRWPRRKGGISAPSAFMPLLEECGLAQDVAEWSLTEACRQAAKWVDVPLCVTVPSAHLDDGSLLAQVGVALAESGLSAERLEISLCEPVLAVDSVECLLTIAALRDLGVGVALDEFGSASANLMTLKRLPLTALKLDRSLVRDLPGDREAAAVVLAAVDFAHALDVVVVACGVDTAEQREFLKRAGCDQAQGALCGRLVPGEAVGALSP
jgi:EAL domain-containing protein (putative c-di-GMP-specific phosphodiesterase class I)